MGKAKAFKRSEQDNLSLTARIIFLRPNSINAAGNTIPASSADCTIPKALCSMAATCPQIAADPSSFAAQPFRATNMKDNSKRSIVLFVYS